MSKVTEVEEIKIILGDIQRDRQDILLYIQQNPVVSKGTIKDILDKINRDRERERASE